MQGVLVYKDKEGNEKDYYFNGLVYGEKITDFLDRRRIEYSEVKEVWTED